MASELIPAIVAVTGGSALLGGIAAHETSREAGMRRSRQAYSVIFPTGAKPEAAVAALAAISGSDYRFEFVFEVAADGGGITHLLHLPQGADSAVIDILSAALPGIRCEVVEPRSTGAVTAAVRIRVPTGAVLREAEPEMAGRALIAGMAALRNDERVSLRWAVRPGGSAPAIPVSNQADEKERARARAHRRRLGQPGFTVAGLLLVRAGSRSRAQLLARHSTGVLRSRRGVGPGLAFSSVRPWGDRELPRSRFARGWVTASELLPLLGLPLGDELIAGVEVGAARRLMVPRGVPREGRRLFIGRDAYGERPVALSTEAAKRHLAVTGATGSGKSVVLARLVLDSLQAAYGGVLIDGKGPDLVNTILDRVPEAHADRVVVLDPAATGPVPGLDLLGIGDPDLRSDVVLGVLRQIFKDAWGPRTESYLRLGLRTLSEQSHPILSDWIRLFTDTRFRRAAVARLSDPLLLAAWRSYEQLSVAEQHQHVAAPMNRVMSLLARPAIRNVLAQESPRLDIDRALRERRWLLISLSPGALGEAATRLLGSIVTYLTWTAVEARAGLPEAARRPVFLVIDELQSLASLPWSVEYLFERARGLGCSVSVATQGLGQLPASLRTSLLANVGSLVTFRAGYDEANRLARELTGLAAADLQALRPYEVAARVSSGAGSATLVMTGRTEPLPPVTGQAERIRQRSAERYGGKANVEAVTKQPPSEANAETALGRGKRS